MSKQKPISGLNLHFIALMNMVDEFKKGNTSEYFEGVEEDDIPFRKINLIQYKIHQIMNLMIDYEYYYDFDASIDWMQGILRYAFAYIDELYQFKLN